MTGKHAFTLQYEHTVARSANTAYISLPSWQAPAWALCTQQPLPKYTASYELPGLHRHPGIMPGYSQTTRFTCSWIILFLGKAHFEGGRFQHNVIIRAKILRGSLMRTRLAIKSHKNIITMHLHMVRPCLIPLTGSLWHESAYSTTTTWLD